MKVLVVSHEFPPIGGGGANACFFLTRGFVERGHEVSLVTANYNGMKEQEEKNGVKIYRVNAKRAHKEHCSFKEMLSYLLKALPLADKLEKKEKFDICLVFFGIPSGPIGYYLKIKYKLPYVIRFGGGDVPGFQERFTKVYKLIAPAIRCIWDKADARVANSQGLKEMALSFHDKNDFDIICNGVDTDIFYPLRREEHECMKILFVSRLIERKGLQHIIPNLREIQAKSGKRIQLVVVGDGPYKETLVQIAKENKVEDLVSFEGQKEKNEIVAYYQDADLFILPSAKEGMPNVVLEAMACGLPILITPCEGSHELIRGNGKICGIDNFVHEMIEMVSNNSMRQEMATLSRQIVEENFCWESVVEKYLKLMGYIIVEG